MSDSPAEPAEPAAARPTPPSKVDETLQPIAVDTARIVAAGTACWLVALVITLVVPALRTGDRDWWPWTCVTGAVLGLLGLLYLRRGRGNAADARGS